MCAQELCPHTAAECRSCTSVLGLARLSFQERKVMRTCATAVGKQYSLALRSAVSVYRCLKSLTALQISMRHIDSLPRCLFFHEKHVHYFLFRGEGMCICNGRVQIQSPPAGRTDTCVKPNVKEVLAAPTRNVEAQTAETACRDLGCPKGQLRVTEGVGGHGLPARALQALGCHRGLSQVVTEQPEVAEVLVWHW